MAAPNVVAGPVDFNTPLIDPKTGLITQYWQTKIAYLFQLLTPRYDVANLTPTRTMDTTTITLPDLANVVGTILTDLQTKGVIPPVTLT